ncbi:MAG: hypothetical protein AAF197_02715, partial [Pseudomonadota bacterium]
HFEDPVPWVRRKMMDRLMSECKSELFCMVFLKLLVCWFGLVYMVFVQLPRETEQNSRNFPRPIYFSDWKPENWHNFLLLCFCLYPNGSLLPIATSERRDG